MAYSPGFQIDVDRLKLEMVRADILQMRELRDRLTFGYKGYRSVNTTDHSLPIAPKMRNPALQDPATLRAAESKMSRIYKATDKNVEFQERTSNYGTSWEYRMFCSRCKSEERIANPKKFLEEVPTDDTIVFCIKHRHDAQANAMRVLSVFSDPQDETAPPEAERFFREEDE